MTVPNKSPEEVFALWRSCVFEGATERDRVLAFYDRVCPRNTPVSSLELQTPLLNLLRRNGVATVERLREMSWGELLGLRGVGLKKATLIRQALNP